MRFVVLTALTLSMIPGVGAAESVRARRPDRPVQLVPRLEINAENAKRFVTHGKCEREGIREIAALLTGSRIEELWAFLPVGPASGACEWHEIGRNERSGSDQAYVDVDWEYLDALMRVNDRVHLYHFHPLAYFDFTNRSASGVRGTSTEAAMVTDLKFAMPSPADIHFMMEITSRFRGYRPRGGEIVNRVVTPYGVVDYALTDAGRAKYETDKDARTQGLYIKYVAASALEDESIRAIVKRHSGDMAISMQELVERLNTRYLRITLSALERE